MKKTEFIKNAAFLILGCGIYAVSVNMFTVPNDIAPGGVTGISTVLNRLFGLPVGTMIIILNIPLFIIGFKKIGRKFLIKTVAATALMSVLIDVFALFTVPYTGDRLLAALYGGVLSGTALSLVFLSGGTTGGTDILARLIFKKLPHIPMGRLIMTVDAFVIVFAAIAFRSLESALYAIIVIFASSRVVDGVLYGADRGKLVIVMSAAPQRIAADILNELRRGATLLEGEGAYSRKKSGVLLCAVRRQEVSRLHAIINRNDPKAFVVVTEAGGIFGEGFRAD